MPILKTRLADANRNLCISTLGILGSIAESMGPPFERYCKFIMSPILGCLSDMKPQIRAACLQTLDLVKASVGIGALLPYLIGALEMDSSVLRKELLQWLELKLADSPAFESDINGLLKSIFLCLEDRNADVRKHSQNCLVHLTKLVGLDNVRRLAEAQKPSLVQNLLSLLDKHRDKTLEKSRLVMSPPDLKETPSISNAGGDSTIIESISSLSRANIQSNTSRSATGSRVGNGTTNSLSTMQTKLSIPLAREEEMSPFFLNADLRAKEVRAEKDKRIRWQFEQPREEFVNLLKDQMEGHISPQLVRCCFSLDFREHLYVLSSFDGVISDLESFARKSELESTEAKLRVLSCSDLIFKYIALRFCETNTSVHLKCLDVLEHLFELMDKENQPMIESEATRASSLSHRSNWG